MCTSTTPRTPADLVVMDDSLRHGLVKHLFVPFLQSLRLGYLLVRRMTMEDIVVSLTWGTCPNMPCCITNNMKRKNNQEKRSSILGRMPHFTRWSQYRNQQFPKITQSTQSSTGSKFLGLYETLLRTLTMDLPLTSSSWRFPESF